MYLKHAQKETINNHFLNGDENVRLTILLAYLYVIGKKNAYVNVNTKAQKEPHIKNFTKNIPMASSLVEEHYDRHHDLYNNAFKFECSNQEVESGTASKIYGVPYQAGVYMSIIDDNKRTFNIAYNIFTYGVNHGC